MLIARVYRSILNLLNNRSVISIVIVSVVIIAVGCTSQRSGTRQATARQDTRGINMLESIELKRRNWENHGTNVIIDGDGSYRVIAIYLGRSETVRTGRLSADQLDTLREQIEKAAFFNLPAEYKAPFKTDSRWWGYDLTIKADQTSNTVRFHSEDETVPETLNQLLEVIKNLTK